MVATNRQLARLVECAAPVAHSMAGAFFDNTAAEPADLAGHLASCLEIALLACVEGRTLVDAERTQVYEIGRALARSNSAPPTLVGVHSILLIGHNEAVHVSERVGGPLTEPLRRAGKRLLEISELIASSMADGFADERSAQARERKTPVEALRMLITVPMERWRRTYFTRIVRKAGLHDMFPAVMAVVSGELPQAGSSGMIRIDRSTSLIAAYNPHPEPHTLVLCPAGQDTQFMAWLRQHVTTRAVYTRAVRFDEAPARYGAVRDILPLSKLIDGVGRLIDARRLLRYRMLASQPVEFIGDYLEETIGPILQLPESQRASLLETLVSLDKHGGSVRTSADELHIHEKTLRYRIDRVEKMTGLNAMSRTAWPHLHLAIQLFSEFASLALPESRSSADAESDSTGEALMDRFPTTDVVLPRAGRSQFATERQ